jgi:hypothetical protein
LEPDPGAREPQGEEKKGTLAMESYARALIFAFAASILCYGCLSSVSSISEPHGRLERASRGAEKMTIKELGKNWRDYIVYYRGVHVGLASAALFHPKANDRTLADTRKPWESTGERWVEVIKNDEANTESEVSRLINAIRVQRWGQFYPRLYRIIGPDGDFCGYLYTAWSRAVIRSDNGTFTVLVKDEPPTSRLVP